MQLGMIGLGRMGGNMVERLIRLGHQCVVYDLSPANVQTYVGKGAAGAASLEEFVKKLTKPRAAWVMVPARPRKTPLRPWPSCWSPATSSSTAAIPTSRMTCAGLAN